jgi:translation initiation factor IF-3
MSKEAALILAKEQPVPVDVILVSPPDAAGVPTCRIRAREAKRSVQQPTGRPGVPLKEKEMRFSSRVAQHDLEVKCRKVIEFLSRGHTVKISVNIQVPRLHELMLGVPIFALVLCHCNLCVHLARAPTCGRSRSWSDVRCFVKWQCLSLEPTSATLTQS